MRTGLCLMMRALAAPARTLAAVSTLVLGIAFLAPGAAHAGANETPGRDYKPHAFAYYSANQWEFGASDVGIFQKYVVGSQHYTQGAAYVDATRDLSPGGAGVWNFFTFCTSRAHDVMLVTSHGVRTPATCIEQYPRTAAGRAVRDSTLNYWNGVFVAGSFVAGNYTTCYTINATQTFYTTYFQTPQALCWWATCWSAGLSMTGPAEARDFLGYDNSVASSKCNCDEETVLNRMDGQQGQALRPLSAALAGINGTCPPGGANLVHTGAGNTVLSPSVLEWQPTGIVCEPTSGYVKFDCTMDLTVAAASVIQAYGDGFLINHAWAGDDKVTYDVIPITPWPTILYDVAESKARSHADRARLDGNTNPAANAKGPNRDDFIWVTTCPYNPYVPVTCPDPTTVPDPSPGDTVNVYTPVTNHTDNVLDVVVTLFSSALPFPITVQSASLPPRGAQTLAWPAPIPPDAVEGQTYPLTFTIQGAGDPVTVPGQIVVGGRLRAELVRPVTLGPGMTSSVGVSVTNLTGGTLLATQAHLTDDQGWSVQGNDVDLSLQAGETAALTFPVSVPEGTPPGAQASFALECVIGTDNLALPLGEASVGLPLTVTRLGQTDVVPGNTDAQIPIEILSLSLTSVNATYEALDSNGYAVTIQAPPVLPPGAPVSGTLAFPVPADPTLIGMEGVIHLTVRDESGYDSQSDIGYTIEPAIEVITEGQSLYTGSDLVQPFPWRVTLRNRSDVPLSGMALLGTDRFPVSPPGMNFNLGPDGTTEIDAQIQVAPDAPAGPLEGIVQTQTASGIGNTLAHVEHEVTTPVTIEAPDRGSSGAAGESLELDFAIWNRRPDQAMSGTFQTSDREGWNFTPASGEYSLAPGARDTLRVTLLLPAQAGTDSVAVTLGMTYDTGLEVQTRASIQVAALGEGTAQVSDPQEPGATLLQGCSPNPFAGAAQIRFRLSRSEDVRLTIHDATGRRIAVLADGVLPAGPRAVLWDGRSEGGRPVPDGIYFLRLETPEGRWVRKAVRMKR